MIMIIIIIIIIIIIALVLSVFRWGLHSLKVSSKHLFSVILERFCIICAFALVITQINLFFKMFLYDLFYVSHHTVNKNIAHVTTSVILQQFNWSCSVYMCLFISN